MHDQIYRMGCEIDSLKGLLVGKGVVPGYDPLLFKPLTLMFFGMWAAAITAISNLLFWILTSPYDAFALFLSWFACFPIGIWIGFRVPGRHFGTYMLFGAIVGPVQYSLVHLIDQSYSSTPYLVSVLVTTTFISIVATAVGGVIGDVGERLFLKSRHRDQSLRRSIRQSMHRPAGTSWIGGILHSVRLVSPVLIPAVATLAAPWIAVTIDPQTVTSHKEEIKARQQPAGLVPNPNSTEPTSNSDFSLVD